MYEELSSQGAILAPVTRQRRQRTAVADLLFGIFVVWTTLCAFALFVLWLATR